MKQEQKLLEKQNETQDIKKLSYDINELKNMLDEYDTYINSQGDKLVEIDLNTNDTEINVRQSDDQLREANRHSNRYKQTLYSVIGIFGGSGIGTAGFLFNPFFGIASTMTGGIAGWALSKKLKIE